MKSVEVLKANGDRVPFREEKLFHSLIRSGASEEDAKQVVNEIVPELYPGISTRKIYRKAYSALKNLSRHLAARYNLKRAIMDLGPSGYPFEKFVGALLSHQGYHVQVGQIVQGQCVNHEVDVMAEKGQQHFMIECKFHNQPGIFCDVKIPLYVQSRFKDVESKWKEIPGHESKFHQGWVVTNTRFSLDAINYGTCAGLKMLGWDYPIRGSLKQIIDELGLYPVTCLTALTAKEKTLLLQNGVVLCVQICNDEEPLRAIHVPELRIKTVLKEGSELCGRLITARKHAVV